jgi:hypothetical protein
MTDLFTKVSQIKTKTKMLIVFPVLFFTFMVSINKVPLQPEIAKRPSEEVIGHRVTVQSPEPSRTAPASVVKPSPEAGKEISSLQQHEMLQLNTAPAASTTHKTSQSTVADSDTSLRQNLKGQKDRKIAKDSQRRNTDSEQPILSSQKPEQSSDRGASSLQKETTTLPPVDDPQNLARCLKGSGTCNHDLLTPEQLTQVEQRTQQRRR